MSSEMWIGDADAGWLLPTLVLGARLLVDMCYCSLRVCFFVLSSYFPSSSSSLLPSNAQKDLSSRVDPSPKDNTHMLPFLPPFLFLSFVRKYLSTHPQHSTVRDTCPNLADHQRQQKKNM